MAAYSVIVTNMGTVWEGTNPVWANKEYGDYVRLSKSNFGRATGESVTLLKDGEPIKEYRGVQEQE